MIVGRCVFAALLVLGCSAPGRAQTPHLTVAIASSPNPVVQGANVTWTLLVTNDGSADAFNVSAALQFPFEPRGYVDVIAGPGWTATTDADIGGCYFPSCGFSYVAFQTSRLARGASATLSAVQKTLAAPGATIEGFAYVTTLPPTAPVPRPQVPLVRGTVTVDGSGPLPSAPSRLSVVASTSTNLPWSAHGVTFDPENATYVTVGSTQSGVNAALLDTAGRLTGSPVALGLPEFPDLPYTKSTDAKQSMLAWTVFPGAGRPRQLFTAVLSLSGGTPVLGDVSVARTALLVEGMLAGRVAHSTTSNLSLLTYSTFRADEPEIPLWALRVSPDGYPLGAASKIDTRGLAHQVKWNGVTNEFGVTYTGEAGSGLSRNVLMFARIGPDGVVRQRTNLGRVSFGYHDIAVNGRTGDFIVVWQYFDFFAAEISRTGRLVSRGLIARHDELEPDLSVTYNQVSGTFLVVDNRGAALELNGYGAPLSAPLPGRPDLGDAIVGTRPDAAEWIVLKTRYVSPNYLLGTDVVGTASVTGGSESRLGGCTTPDPFEVFGGGVCYGGGWLPPGIPAPGIPVTGGCTTPDPFVALGGGACVDGGWLPPGMAPPAPPAPATCITPDPFVVLGGGVCVNGGWVPRSHPLAQPAALSCSGSDPFLALGGGLCVNGAWVPRRDPKPHYSGDSVDGRSPGLR